MNNEIEKEQRNSVNRFELEGNIGNINDVYVTKNGKKILRFDLGQNNNGNNQFVPIVLRGELVNSYGSDMKKGNWITVKGRIATFTKDVERNGNTYKEKVTEILGFEVTDRTLNKVYTSDGQVQEINSEKEMER